MNIAFGRCCQPYRRWWRNAGTRTPPPASLLSASKRPLPTSARPTTSSCKCVHTPSFIELITSVELSLHRCIAVSIKIGCSRRIDCYSVSYSFIDWMLFLHHASRKTFIVRSPHISLTCRVCVSRSVELDEIRAWYWDDCRQWTE